MSSLTRHEVVQWFTTPKELREIADDMERKWAKMLPGHNKTTYVSWGGDTELRILVDQERIDK